MVGTNAIRRFAGRKVYRFGLAFALFALPLTACSTGADAANSAQVLVDRSTLTVETMLGSGAEGNQASQFLRRAKAVVVCPRSPSSTSDPGAQCCDRQPSVGTELKLAIKESIKCRLIQEHHENLSTLCTNLKPETAPPHGVECRVRP